MAALMTLPDLFWANMKNGDRLEEEYMLGDAINKVDNVETCLTVSNQEISEVRWLFVTATEASDEEIGYVTDEDDLMVKLIQAGSFENL